MKGSELGYRYLLAMGITPWVRRAPLDERGAVSVGRTDPASGGATGDWAELASTVARCTLCPLCKTRTQTVFGVGDVHAQCLVVGEAPGADEDRLGEPFVGRAGRLLNSMLSAIGLRREEVYIANILKCRPPRNRDPRPEEMKRCEPYLLRQIELLGPRVILAVGRIAAQSLLESAVPIGRLRGVVRPHPRIGIPVVVSYHPAYLLRSPLQKRKAWDDLRLLRQVLDGQ